MFVLGTQCLHLCFLRFSLYFFFRFQVIFSQKKQPTFWFVCPQSGGHAIHYVLFFESFFIFLTVLSNSFNLPMDTVKALIFMVIWTLVLWTWIDLRKTDKNGMELAPKHGMQNEWLWIQFIFVVLFVLRTMSWWESKNNSRKLVREKTDIFVFHMHIFSLSNGLPVGG